MEIRGYIFRLYHRYKRFIIFCTGGGIGAIINWIISFFLTSILGIYYVASYTLAQVVNISFNFMWNRHITFKVKDKAQWRFLKFVTVSSSTALFSIFLVWSMKEFVLDNIYTVQVFGYDMNYMVAIIMVTFIVSVINYVLNKIWVFGDSRKLIILLGKIFFLCKKRKKTKNPQNILIIRSGGIGDVLMSTPLVNAIRHRYLKTQITYFVGNFSKHVLLHNKDINGLFSYDDLTIVYMRISGILQLIKEIRNRKFDICFNLEKSWHWGVLSFLFGIPYRVGFDRYGEGFAYHKAVPFSGKKYELEYYLDIARLMDISIKTKDILVYTTEKEELKAKQFIKDNGLLGKKLIGISPGGADNPAQKADIKRWPVNHYVSFCTQVLDTNENSSVIVFGGKNDVKTAEKIQNQEKRVISCAGNLSITESAALMKQCHLFVTHDSGPMHLAAGVKVPLIALFGPTQEERFGPPHAVILRSKSCKACYNIYGTFKDCNDNVCMKDITVSEVMKKAVSILKLSQ